MGLATVDSAIVNAGLQGEMQRLNFSKVFPSATVALTPHSSWLSTGLPVAGTTVGLSSGRALLKSSGGGFDYLQDASSGQQTVLAGIAATSPTALGTLILCDRMADCGLDLGTASAVISGCDGTARMAATTAPGDGGQLWAEVTTALGAGVNTVSFTTTNELGTSPVVTTNMATVASAVVGRSPNANLWQPLASGQVGVRVISGYNSSVVTSGVISACIVRPLGTIPLFTANQYTDRDFIVEVPALPKIYDNACLFFLYIPVSAVTPTLFGELRTLAG